MTRKKAVQFTLVLAAILLLTTSCAGEGKTTTESFDQNKKISVISREDGSGTRSAFVELFGIRVKNADHTEKDRTTKEAIVADKTDIALINISNDPYAIGYLSLGSMNDTVKGLAVDGITATAEHIKDGTYPVRRSFVVAVREDTSALARDFIDFILSAEGQDIVAGSRYIPVNDTKNIYKGGQLSGKITISGSSSVSPVMEKLREAYLVHHPQATIEIQMSDSTAGMTAAMNGTCDIGMSSRGLKEKELAVLTDTPIALDGLVLVVNKSNPLENITSRQVGEIFMGNILRWGEIQ